MATYTLDTGEKYTYEQGNFWCDEHGKAHLDMPHNMLPVPPLYSEEGTHRCDGFFELVITNIQNGLVVEMQLRPVRDVILMSMNEYPGFVMTEEEQERIVNGLNLSQDDAVFLADVIPYALNEGFGLDGGRLDLGEFEDLDPRFVDWKLK